MATQMSATAPAFGRLPRCERGRWYTPAVFPLTPPIEPMLAKIADALPAGDAFLYEP